MTRRSVAELVCRLVDEVPAFEDQCASKLDALLADVLRELRTLEVLGTEALAEAAVDELRPVA